ncbi:MAG: cation-translocating P-type ATPase [Anaerolineales bacterium]
MSIEQLNRQTAGRQSIDDVCEHFGLDPAQGLSSEDAKARLEHHGPNAIQEQKARSAVEILIEQFRDPIIWLLVAAGVAAIAIGSEVEGIAVFAVVIVNALVGFFTELQAAQSMEALKQMGEVKTAVRRDGRVRKIPAKQLVPGDIIILDAGDMVSADLRLLEANRLQTDEAALTGESKQVTKNIDVIPEEVVLAEQFNVAFKGTAITRGTGEGVVFATGMNTEIGHISEMVQSAESETTPLEKRLDALGQRLIGLTLGIAVVVTAAGLLAGRDLQLMIETGIALAIASVPEGLPITATIALARGMRRMANRNALVNRLETVETLGSTNIICTDKTGTLTQGRMSVEYFQLQDEQISLTGDALSAEGGYQHDGEPLNPHEMNALARAIQVGVLCSNAEVNLDQDDAEVIGEPLEVALQVAGRKAGYARHELLKHYPETREVAFDPDAKMMATYHECDGGYRVAVKGAPEAVLDICARVQHNDDARPLTDEDRQAWQERNASAAERGLRVLALAEKTVDSAEAEPYQDLTLLGIAGLLDPPRLEVKSTIEECLRAGIRLVMVTGDQALTARNIAAQLSIATEEHDEVIQGEMFGGDDDLTQRILKSNILSRVSPAQKLQLIELHQNNGHIVAMTGDGVNDAPALKKADIGVAMGSGTQVAKDAADMILQDDNLDTIVLAIRQGRVIFNNIRTFMIYLFSSNVSTIFTVGVAAVLNAPLPLLPLQILFLNVVVDVFPALALGVGEDAEDVMEHPPREPDTSILERQHWGMIAAYGTLIAGSVLGAFALAHQWLGLDGNAAVTIAFLTLMLAKLWHVFNMRSASESIFDNVIIRNRYVWGALGLSLALIFMAVFFPPLAALLSIVTPTLEGWGLAIGMSLIPFVVVQVYKSFPKK